VTLRDRLEDDPQTFDLFRVLREYERSHPEKPRIGDNQVLKDEVVSLGQDPFLEFPYSNISGLTKTSRGTPKLLTRFLGFFGPQGALPLTTTLEAHEWITHNDPSFARFTDIFVNRFLQLFYRAWADARPIAQHDRPKEDRFARYIGAFAGIGTPPFAERDSVPDIGELPYAGLVSSRIKSARRLVQLIQGVFRLQATIIERIGTWLVFEPGDRMSLGTSGSALGVDTFVGNRSYSLNDKFRIAITARNLEEYESLLPDQPLSSQLADLVFFHLGYRFEYDVELALPARLAPPTALGKSGRLGWTSWVNPRPDADEGTYLRDARFDLAERRRVAKASEIKAKTRKAGTKR
jgi:type VI secretion system protein ImpH